MYYYKRTKERSRLSVFTHYLPNVVLVLALVSLIWINFNGIINRRRTTSNININTYVPSSMSIGNLSEITNKVAKRIKNTLAPIVNEEKTTSSPSKVLRGCINNEKQVEQKQIPPPPMKLEDIFTFITSFLNQLHALSSNAPKNSAYQDIWKIYHDLALETLYPWDQEYLKRMPTRRNDGTIFLSIASYRDDLCLATIQQAFAKAKNPDKLYIGLVQQNCAENCLSGTVDSKQRYIPPDEDAHKLFCDSDEGKPHCDAGRLRTLHVNETESLGPYAARFFASKLWYGEEWFMQIDAHMTFAQDWDALSIEMLEDAPSKKPIISHYPPVETFDFDENVNTPAPRLCGGILAISSIESQIVRLQFNVDDRGTKYHTPRIAPVIAAGYVIASSEFLSECPFDPFLPWIFMGEEIIMTTRLWTHGYDIFSPTRSVVGHYYKRKGKPKFWENVHRVFHYGAHNPLQMMILDRIKYQIGYPESSRDMIAHKSVLSKVEDYTLGTERNIDDYLYMSGFDLVHKETFVPEWCKGGLVPDSIPEYQQYSHLYNRTY